MTAPPLPPEDDPLFNQWIKDVGSLREMPELPEVQISRPLVAALTVLCCLAVIAAAGGWALYFFASQLTPVDLTVPVLLGIATLMIAGGIGWLARRRP